MTLLEMLGALTIIAILAAVMLPVAIRLLDRVAINRETSALQSLGDALQASIQRARAIPDYGGWHLFIATNAGIELRSITNNLRNRKRVLLVDESAGSWLPGRVPYQQTPAGSAVVPTQARMMIVSTIAGPDLPFESRRYGSEFEELWNAPPGTLPSSAPWNNSFKADDVIIQRLNLAPLFVRLVLGTYWSATNGMYNFDRGPAIYAAPLNSGFGACFLRGTELDLYSGMPSTNFMLSTVLNEDVSYVYEGGVWKSSLVKAAAKGIGDISDIVAKFLAATPNTNALMPYTNAQQIQVVLKFLDFMTNYNMWASSNFTKTAKTSLGLATKQADMMTAVQGLFLSLNGSNFFPTPLPCSP